MAWQDAIPAWVRRQERPVTVTEISAQMQISQSQALRRVKSLVASGELVDLGGDRLEAAPRKWDREPMQAPPVQERIWKACVYSDMKGAWTAAEIARTAEANRDYVSEYLRWLAAQGHVRCQLRPGKTTYYRLHPDAPPIGQPPIWVNRRNRALRARSK